MLDPIERHAIELATTRAVKALLDFREALGVDESIDDGDVRMEFGAFIDAMRYAAGPEICGIALPPIQLGQGRKQQLDSLANSTSLLSSLGAIPADSLALNPISSIAGDLHAIAKGDAPYFLRQIDGPKRKYRAASAKLQALCWDAFLRSAGYSESSRHAAISEAYGTEWDTISRWPSTVRKVLGKDLVDKHIRVSSRQGAKMGDAWRQDESRWRKELCSDGSSLKQAQQRSSV